MEKDCFATAIWKEGPLFHCERENEWMKKSYEFVTLKFLYDLQNITDEFINKVKSRSGVIFGISQNPDTGVYLLVICDKYFDHYCKCGNVYDQSYYKWCKECRINQLKNNFTNWTSGNIIFDDFIQKMQLKINKYYDSVFDWIPYNEIIIIEELEHYTSAIWKKGPLYYTDDKKLVRKSYEKVDLKYLYNSQEITDEFSNEVESYLKSGVIFGISQNPDTKVHILVFYNEYLICYCEKCGKSREKVYLKYLYNSQEITADFSNEVESYLENKVIFGISQNPDTEVYLLVFNVEYFDRYGEKCGNEYDDIKNKWCEQCQMNYLKNNFTDWTSGNEKVDNFIQKMQLKVNVYQGGIFEWISYNEFIEIKEIENNVLATAIWKDGPLYYSSIRMSYNREINIKVILKYLVCNSQNVSHLSLSEVIYSVKENYGITQNPNTKDYMLVCKIEYYCENCGKGGFSTVYSAIWKDGVLFYDCNPFKTGWKRQSNTKVALKCLNNSQNFLDEFVNEVKAYTNQKIDNILKIYGISQNPNTKEYIMVLEYAEGGNFINYLKEKCEVFDWSNGLKILTDIIIGLNTIHQKQMIHCDFHIGNILFKKLHNYNVCISDMGLCKKIDDINETSIYGVMPYVAPEVLKGNPYTQAADIYSFGMIMYVIATGKQPFANCAHDVVLALNICNGIRPEINDQITPKCYIDLMKKCWDSNPDNRPNSVEIKELIFLFNRYQINKEIEKQFNETQGYRKENFLSIKNNQLTTHTQAIYTSRLLNPFTKNLSKYEDNFNSNTVEITDFTNL
ncbi:unnamed protein product [Rhizophagus irregularis]|nr:unnamed protein product [Rhizophagus irregularis]